MKKNWLLKKGIMALSLLVIGFLTVNVNAISINPNYSFSSSIDVDKTEVVKSSCDASDVLLNYSATASMTDELADTLVSGMTTCMAIPGVTSANCSSILGSADFTITVNYDADLVVDFTSLSFTSTFLEMTSYDATTPGTLLVYASLKDADFATFDKATWQTEMVLTGAVTTLTNQVFEDKINNGLDTLGASGSITGTVVVVNPITQATTSTTISSDDATPVETTLSQTVEACDVEAPAVPSTPVVTNPDTGYNSMILLSCISLVAATGLFLFLSYKKKESK